MLSPRCAGGVRSTLQGPSKQGATGAEQGYAFRGGLGAGIAFSLGYRGKKGYGIPDSETCYPLVVLPLDMLLRAWKDWTKFSCGAVRRASLFNSAHLSRILWTCYYGRISNPPRALNEMPKGAGYARQAVCFASKRRE